MRKIQIIIFSLLFGICNDSISQILLSFSVENETREIVNVSDFLRRKLNLSDTFEFQSINGIPVFKNEEGIIHERYVQCYKGIIIENTDIRVRKKNGIIISANGDYINNSQINIEHTQSLSEACKIAETYIRSQYVELKNNSLTISPQKEIVLFVKTTESKVIACYKIKVFSIDNLISENVYIDACDGTVVNSFTGILHAIGNADTRFSGTQNISTKYNGLNYILFDTTRGNGIETLNLKRSLNFNSAVNFKDNDDNWTSIEFNNSNMDDGALDAHWGAMKTYDYFKNVHGRNSFDGNNSKLRNYVHAKVLLNMDYAYDNAVWVIDSNFMIYINGWLKHSNVMSAIDIVGHEIAHGVCKYTATLSYQGESGAINESLSDIWGACIEKFATSNKQTYLCGEDLGVPERSMSNPKVYFQPNTYKGIFWGETSNPSNNNDWGNVHTNSGVMNYWFYLLSEGGSGTNDNGWNYSVNGISIDSAAKIVYKAETEYMTSNTNFVKAREYTIKAAQDIFGVNSSKIQLVKDAWYAVGVYNDLYIRDTVTDNGTMPSVEYSTWDSPDIWIMDTNGNWVNNPPLCVCGSTIAGMWPPLVRNGCS